MIPFDDDAPLPGSGPGAPDARYAYTDATAESQIVRVYLGAIYRRRWIALAVFTVVFGLLAVRTFRATPIYAATARILIESDVPNIVSFDEVMQINRRALEYFQTQYRLLTSRALAKRALELSNLISDPAFMARAPAATAAPVAANPLATLRREGETVLATTGESASEPAAIARFLAGLTVTPIRNTRLVDVTFASANPAIAQRGANAVVEAYIQQNAELRSSATRDAGSFLSQMVAEQRTALEQSELALQRYREGGDSISVEDRQNIILERVARLSETVTKARTDRIQKETVYNNVRTAASDIASLESVPAVRDNLYIQRLKAEIGDLRQRKADLEHERTERHPDMIRATAAIQGTEARLGDEVKKIVESIRAEYAAAVDLERAMTEALEQQRKEALALNRRGIDYGVMQRDATSNRTLYEALLQRTKETGIAEQMKTSNVRSVDAAELPRRPVRPRKMRDVSLGFMGAIVLALGLVFTLEAFDTRIKSPDDVAQRLKLVTLGMVPQCKQDEFARGELLIGADAPQNFVEAFRSLRTSLLFASAERGTRSVLISSTAPREGKTLVSCNLAMALALAGPRVLLVDADMRRPKVHDVFGCPLGPGLSNVLVGEVTADAAIQATSTDRLHILSAGTLPPNPPELLGSPQFVELMQSMAERFDWIVLDSPPVRAVTDAAVIAHFVTAVVFVVGSEMTDGNAAKVALERLAATKARFAGIVLNRVQLRRHSYYYSQYYGRADERYYARHPDRA